MHREGRLGFKAGNLAFGMEHAKGEFLAIFDADFVPPADWLKKQQFRTLSIPKLDLCKPVGDI